MWLVFDSFHIVNIFFAHIEKRIYSNLGNYFGVKIFSPRIGRGDTTLRAYDGILGATWRNTRDEARRTKLLVRF